MKRFTLLFAALLLAAGSFASAAQAQSSSDADSDDIRRLLEERDRQIKNVLGDKESFTDEQRDKLMDLINGVINFQAMGRTALGPHWQDLSPAQRDTFATVFSRIVRRQSLSDLNVYRSDVTYEQIDVTGDSAYVLTTTVYKDVPTKVEYTLGYDDEADAWKAHDIILDDVSTAEGYARSFQNVVRRHGFSVLMKSLRNKLNKINKNS
jgi:phospholipid transport system substrate-binding protein